MVSANNAINNTVGASVSGVTNTLTVTNPSDTASSAARSTITVGGASAADPTLNFNVSGITDFEMGIDNNDSDSFKLSASTALGTTDTFIMTTAGERTMPLQPAFLATKTATQSNITGDATLVACEYTTEIFDQNADYDGTSIFTAPVTGRYLFNGGIVFSGFSTAYANYGVRLVASNRALRIGGLQSPGKIFNDATDAAIMGGVIVDMDAADTAFIEGFAGGSSKTIDFINTGASFFAGGLMV